MGCQLPAPPTTAGPLATGRIDPTRCIVQSRHFIWQRAVRGMAALAMLAVCALSGTAGPAPGKKGPRVALPAEIVTAWKKAGAEVGWMREGTFAFVPEKEGVDGDLPAFRFSLLKKGLLAKLPAPAAAFGLDLRETPTTDAELKELAGLENLQTLSLSENQVTDAGLKGLAGLKNLQTLSLYGTKVTDVGLKELAGLKNLQTLDLGKTEVTDAGLKELAGLKNLRRLNLVITAVTDRGLKELAGVKNVQTLHLGE